MNGLMFFDNLAQQSPRPYLEKKGNMKVLNDSVASFEPLPYKQEAITGDKENGSPVDVIYQPISPIDFYNDENSTPQSYTRQPHEEDRLKYSQRNGFTQQGNHETLVFVNTFRDNYHHSSNNPQSHRNNNYNRHRPSHNWNSSKDYESIDNNYNKRQQNTYKRAFRRDQDTLLRRAHGLTNRFQSRLEVMKFDLNPEKLTTGGPYDFMNRAIYEVFVNKVQKIETYQHKILLWRNLFLYMRRCLSHYALYIVGSTMTGFGLDSSDIDMCLLIKPCTDDPRLDSLHHLNNIKHQFVKYGLTVDPELIMAKVPILKFREESTGFEIDLNCNNSVGIHNTHMLYCYARLDWRVRPLVVVVKIWAQANGINDAKNLTVSSYSWTLMVINYLQCGLHPTVLPCLHKLYPDLFNAEKNRINDVHEDICLFDNYKSENTASLAELLIGFFEYYSGFDFNQDAVSVRTGTKLPIDECRNHRALKNDVNQWRYLCIEEPFDFTNTARSVYDIMAFRHIKYVIDRSFDALVKTNDLNRVLPVDIGEEAPPFVGYQGERKTLIG